MASFEVCGFCCPADHVLPEVKDDVAVGEGLEGLRREVQCGVDGAAKLRGNGGFGRSADCGGVPMRGVEDGRVPVGLLEARVIGFAGVDGNW